MTTVSKTSPALTPAQAREAQRAAILAGLGQFVSSAPASTPDVSAALVQSLPAAFDTAAQPQQLLLQATTVREFEKVYELLEPGRDPSRHARLTYWLDRIGDIALAQVTHEDIDRVLAELESTPGSRGTLRTGSTVNRYRMAFAGLIKFARRRRRLPRDWVSPLANLPQHTESAGRSRVLSPEEETRLMAVAATQQWPLLALVIRIALTTALRRSNIENLQWRNVDFDEQVLRIERTKNGEPHISPMLPDVAATLKAIKPARAEAHHCVFHAPSTPNKPRKFNGTWLRAVKDAGIEDFRFHDLRHTSCSRLGIAGVDALQIAEHSGHKSLKMVQRYTHLNVASRAKLVNEIFAR